MFALFRSLWPGRRRAAPVAAIPAGERVFAIGDIHGRLDLFATLIGAIESEIAALPPAHTTIILLGDLVDRGSDSAGVLARAQSWQAQCGQAGCTLRILAGNHEEMFLKSFDNLEVLRHFLRHGGRETLLSFGVSRAQYNAASIEQAQALLQANVPGETRAFIEGFEDMIAIGDYLFVHAGIAPEVPFTQQTVADLRWIREPFLSFEGSHGPVVVHGHTITDRPVETASRIGIDTGAYASGRLTALVLEGSERRYLVAVANEQGCTIER